MDPPGQHRIGSTIDLTSQPANGTLKYQDGRTDFVKP
jgi:hypothetical protein